MKLLVAEDDPRLLKMLVHIFEKNNYAVDGVSDGEAARDYALSGEYDGIILDIMMPKMDGVQVLKSIREKGVTAPVLFLTAKTEIYYRVEGLDAGADDYIPKPFSSQELLARVRAMLRRKDNYQPSCIAYSNIVLNCSTYQLTCNDKTLNLGGKEFQIMEMLMHKPGMVIGAEQFMTHIWSWDTDVDVSVIWVHISNLRKKLAAIGAKAEIKLVRNIGYVLEEKR